MAKKDNKNPYFTKKRGWLWVVCAPAALVGSSFWEADRQFEKKQQKKYEKNKRFIAEYGYWWW